MFKIGYGLYVITLNDSKKDNALIVNTVCQIANNPTKIAVTISKQNYSHNCVKASGKMNVCCLSEDAPFDIFKAFGFASGRDTDKFAGRNYPTTENGLTYIPEHVNAVMSAKVVGKHDYGTHTLFVAEVTEAKTLSDEPSVTYAYYQSNIKPKASAPKAEGKVKWVCKVCGYTHEDETLPEDFVCPWCKHPAEDFEKVIG